MCHEPETARSNVEEVSTTGRAVRRGVGRHSRHSERGNSGSSSSLQEGHCLSRLSRSRSSRRSRLPSRSRCHRSSSIRPAVTLCPAPPTALEVALVPPRRCHVTPWWFPLHPLRVEPLPRLQSVQCLRLRRLGFSCSASFAQLFANNRSDQVSLISRPVSTGRHYPA